ncbi:RidA family protein [Prosthecomicrobium sp. N25]|uniref:RidA family protein n=1 Tax=Prosthecomicrobium sp. N25 TaxID=3129254 RepID=UPI003076E089
MTPEARLARLGLVLPEPPKPVASYVTHVIEGGFLYLSGQGPRDASGRLQTGKVGRDVSVETAYGHARLTGLGLLAVAKGALGELSRVKRVVKLLGMVNAEPDFADHPAVVNGCSDLFLEVFGERGAHARSAVGMGSLPGGISVEIEAILAVEA